MEPDPVPPAPERAARGAAEAVAAVRSGDRVFVHGGAAVPAGRADFVPVFLSDIPALFRSGRLPLDVALLNVSPPDAHGFCSLGTSVDVALAAAQSARVVLA